MSRRRRLARSRQPKLTRPIPELARSYVHLPANHLARGYPVEQELVLHSLLARLYRTRLARGA